MELVLKHFNRNLRCFKGLSFWSMIERSMNVIEIVALPLPWKYI